jgi:NTP pyrophosphatase (non-canonical NTP hydrolase)
MEELGETVRAAHKFERARGAAEEDETKDHFGKQLADCLASFLSWRTTPASTCKHATQGR